MDINNWISKNKDRLIGMRRHIHSYPEVGFKEFKTSKYIQNILKKSSFSIKQNKSMQTGFCVDYGKIKGFSNEVREKLQRHGPATLGAAGRIPGQ